MATNRELIELAAGAFTPNYRPAPIALDRGEGVYVFDVEGRRYLDMISGIAVSALGHGHPGVTHAIEVQSKKLLHTSNLYVNEPAVRLAVELSRLFAGGRVFFSNSGAEANEAAIKLARRFHHDRKDASRREIVTFEGSFHGRTYGALAATAQPKYHEGFEPMPGAFVYCPMGDLAAVEAKVGAQTAAIMVEPIQGEGGVHVPPSGFLRELRDLADRVGALLIFDEVQTGIGRTGYVFAHEHEGVRPDIMTLAKGLGGGLPVGAMLASEAVAASLVFGTHATTFGGNPVSASVGRVVLEAIQTPGFLSRIRELGEQLKSGLSAISAFSEVRGRGLLIGAELSATAKFQAKDIVDGCRSRGLLVHVAGPRVLRLAPPLVIEPAHVSEALGIIKDSVEALGA